MRLRFTAFIGGLPAKCASGRYPQPFAFQAAVFPAALSCGGKPPYSLFRATI
jgi:hypothetical protein